MLRVYKTKQALQKKKTKQLISQIHYKSQLLNCKLSRRPFRWFACLATITYFSRASKIFSCSFVLNANFTLLHKSRQRRGDKLEASFWIFQLAWLLLRTQNLAWGYFLPSPPPGFDYQTVYRTWTQFDEAEAACMERIRQGRKMQVRLESFLLLFSLPFSIMTSWNLIVKHSNFWD